MDSRQIPASWRTIAQKQEKGSTQCSMAGSYLPDYVRYIF